MDPVIVYHVQAGPFWDWKVAADLFLIFQTFTNFAPTSPLWWGGVFQTIFIAGATWYAWKWRTTEADRGRRILGLALTPIAIIVGAYHGLLLQSSPPDPSGTRDRRSWPRSWRSPPPGSRP